MFAKQIYQSNSLSQLSSAKQKFHIHAFQITTSERHLLVSLLHMLLGMPSLYFQLNKSKQKPAFTLSSSTIQLLHLSPPTLKTYFEEILTMSNNILTIKVKIKVLYSYNNAFLRALAEGISYLMNHLIDFFNSKLKTVQQQSGNITRNAQQLTNNLSKSTTLLSLLISLRQNQEIIDFVLKILQKYNLQINPSQKQLQKIVLILINQYYRECDKQFCQAGKGRLVHLLFGPLMHAYFKLCQEWLQMNEAILGVRKGSGFFLQLQSVVKIQDQQMLQFKRMIHQDMVPMLFRKSYKKIIQLGKTIQYIKLYYNQDQRNHFKQYLSISQQFTQIHSYIDKLAQKQKNTTLFQPKKRHFQNISQRLAKIAKPVILKNVVSQDNPYNMYPQTKGIFTLKPLYQDLNTIQQQFPKEVVKSDSVEPLSVNLQLSALFDDLLERVSCKCIKLLSQQRIRQSIQLTLTGIKKIMLFQQGDFIQEFIQLAGELLNRPSQKISRNNIERIIEEAVRSSGAQNMPESIRDNISFTFLRNGERTGVKGWRIFSLLCLPQRPTNCIFTARVMEQYGCISNLLFNLRHCQEVLVFMWQNYLIEGMARVLRVRNAVNLFVKALQSYIFAELQHIWNGLLEAIHQSGSLIAIIEANQNVLQQMKTLTVENKALKNCLLSLLKVVDRFQSIHKALETGQIQNFQNDLDQIWPWFLGVLDQSRQIGTFSDTFNMQSIYSI